MEIFFTEISQTLLEHEVVPSVGKEGSEMGLDALKTNNDVSCVSCHCHIESILLGTHKTRVGGFV